jgi:hypothetical protein
MEIKVTTKSFYPFLGFAKVFKSFWLEEKIPRINEIKVTMLG